MDEREFHVLIKHYFMKGKLPPETKEKLDKHYGESAPSIRTVYKWFNNFRCSHMSTSDAERSGRPVEATTPEIVDKIHDMVMDDRRVKVRVKLLVLWASRVNGYIIFTSTFEHEKAI
jgi:transposase